MPKFKLTIIEKETYTLPFTAKTREEAVKMATEQMYMGELEAVPFDKREHSITIDGQEIID